MSKGESKIISVTCLICPNCGSANDRLPPAMQEAITDGDKFTCVACDAPLVVQIRVPESDVEQRDEAERAGARQWLGCHSDHDGECSWASCPQLRDGEPVKSGRHCPLDIGMQDE